MLIVIDSTPARGLINAAEQHLAMLANTSPEPFLCALADGTDRLQLVYMRASATQNWPAEGWPSFNLAYNTTRWVCHSRRLRCALRNRLVLVLVLVGANGGGSERGACVLFTHGR